MLQRSSYNIINNDKDIVTLIHFVWYLKETHVWTEGSVGSDQCSLQRAVTPFPTSVRVDNNLLVSSSNPKRVQKTAKEVPESNSVVITKSLYSLWSLTITLYIEAIQLFTLHLHPHIHFSTLQLLAFSSNVYTHYWWQLRGYQNIRQKKKNVFFSLWLVNKFKKL